MVFFTAPNGRGRALSAQPCIAPGDSSAKSDTACLTYNRRMKRAFLILLLAILPFQMSWATAAAYCQHEQGKTAQHFGHHEHQHQTSDAERSDNGGTKYHDNDCSYHHLSAVKSLCSAVQTPASPPRSLPIAFLSPSFDSHIPDGLIRPDWRIVS